MKKKLLILSVLCISMFQMGMVVLSPVISAMTEAFPHVPSLAVQMAMTFLNFVVVFVALFSGAISRKIGRRWMCVIGMALTAAAGILGTALTVHFVLVYVWSALLGIGMGLFVPAVNSIIMDCLESDERQRVMGIQTASVNLGGMILSFLSGVLAGIRWSNAYLVFLLAIPVMILSLYALPTRAEEPARQVADKPKAKIPGSVFLAAGETALFAVLYFAFSTNVSLLLTEKGYLSTSASGTATAIFMLGGCLAGFVFTTVLRLAKSRTPAVAYAVLVLSYVLLWTFDSFPLLLLGAFLGGGSLSLIFPYFVVTIANQVDASVSVIASSLIVSVGPNLGSFVSPVIVSCMTSLCGLTRIADRFLVSAVAAAIICCILLIKSRTKRKKDEGLTA